MSKRSSQIDPIAPTSLTALRSIVEAQCEAPGKGNLGPRSLQLLGALVDHPEQVSLHGISQLAALQNVNPSTLTRLAHRLGFSGFKEFQKLFRRDIVQSSRFYSSQAARHHRLRGDALPSHDDKAAQQHPVSDSELNNLLKTIEGLDRGTLETVAAHLSEARRVYIIGLRGCYSAAHYFGYYLSFLRSDVITLGGAGFTLAEDLSAIGPEDIFVAITFHPETRQTLECCKMAREMGATVVTASNSAASPVRAFGHHNFNVHSDGPFFFNPVAALFFLIETLIAQVADSMGSEVIRILKQRETVFGKLEIE